MKKGFYVYFSSIYQISCVLSGENPMSEECGALSKHNRGYECSMVLATAMDITEPSVLHSSVPLSSSCSFKTFKPTPLSQTSSLESTAS